MQYVSDKYTTAPVAWELDKLIAGPEGTGPDGSRARIASSAKGAVIFFQQVKIYNTCACTLHRHLLKPTRVMYDRQEIIINPIQSLF